MKEYRVIYQNEIQEKPRIKDFKRKSAFDRWLAFIKENYDAHYLCYHDDDDGYWRNDTCKLPDEWKDRDPKLIRLDVYEREVTKWQKDTTLPVK